MPISILNLNFWNFLLLALLLIASNSQASPNGYPDQSNHNWNDFYMNYAVRDVPVTTANSDEALARFRAIQGGLRTWFSNGGFRSMQLPQGLGSLNYMMGMATPLMDGVVIVKFVTTAQEQATRDPELKLQIDGQEKTCRGFVSTLDRRAHILCNTERFLRTPTVNQFRLVHHEFAGLAGLESNRGAASDYQISSQISFYLYRIDGALEVRPERATVDMASKGWTYLGSISNQNDEHLAEQVCNNTNTIGAICAKKGFRMKAAGLLLANESLPLRCSLYCL